MLIQYIGICAFGNVFLCESIYFCELTVLFSNITLCLAKQNAEVLVPVRLGPETHKGRPLRGCPGQTLIAKSNLHPSIDLKQGAKGWDERNV